MPRQNIYFTDDTLTRLRKFIRNKHGTHRAMSMTVQQAITEFLQRQDGELPVEPIALPREPYKGREERGVIAYAFKS